MKNVSTGLGLAVLGVGVGLHAFSPRTEADPSRGVPDAARGAVAAAAARAGAATIVWYGTGSGDPYYQVLYRGWSDGTVEMRRLRNLSQAGWCEGVQPCASPWLVVASPDEGLSAAADVNFDETVDGADLAMVLGAWGPAPRNPTPPSDCPLELIMP